MEISHVSLKERLVIIVGRQDTYHKGECLYSPQDIQVSDTVVTGILPLFSNFAKTLFDSGSTHSFISYRYAKLCDKKLDLWIMTCL